MSYFSLRSYSFILLLNLFLYSAPDGGFQADWVHVFERDFEAGTGLEVNGEGVVYLPNREEKGDLYIF